MIEDITPEEIKNQFKNNKNLRMTTYIIGGVVVLVLGYFAYRQFIYNPANEDSKLHYYAGLNYATADSTEMALDELRGQVNKYDGKVGGEVAQFVYARQLMANKEFEKAIDELEGVNVKDTYVSAMAIGLQGDCKSELEKYEEAANLYLEAADANINDMTTPMYLMKAGLCAEEVKDFETATQCYQRIKDEFAAFASNKSIDKYLERAKNKIAE